MRVWVLGSGGREHAIGWAFKKSGYDVIFVPGNGGTDKTGENIPCKTIEETKKLIREREKDIDVVIPGSESYIASGIADVLEEKTFSPRKAEAFLEASKISAKRFMKKHGIKTARFKTATTRAELEEALKFFSPPYVLKADPLAGGKGVIIVEDRSEAISKGGALMEGKLLKGVSGGLVIEEYLPGEELSAIAVIGEKGFELLPLARDYKRAFDGDRGPNTGGMGCYSPVKVEQSLIEKIEEILDKTIEGLKREGMSYRGFLYLGLMIVEGEPYVLEYNVRLGDPEAEAIIPLDPEGFVKMVLTAFYDGIPECKMKENLYAVDVVVASEGYPVNPRKGMEVEIPDNGLYFFAGVERKNGKLIVSGGRVIHAVGLGKTLKEARETAYENALKVRFKGAFYRKDIANNV